MYKLVNRVMDKYVSIEDDNPATFKHVNKVDGYLSKEQIVDFFKEPDNSLYISCYQVYKHNPYGHTVSILPVADFIMLTA